MSPSRRRRRGVAAVVTVLMLMVVTLLVLGLVTAGARDQSIAVRRIESVQAFYAAEAGMNMALRELMESSDEDGDGGVGSISDDDDEDDDPQLGMARVVVTLAGDGGTTTLVASGSAGDARRELVATLEE